MMNSNLLATLPAPTTAAPAPAPAPAPGSGSEPGAFGRELQRAAKASQDDSAAESTPEPGRTDPPAAQRQRSERRIPQATEHRSAAPGKAVKPSEGPADGSADITAAIDASDEAAPDVAATVAVESVTPAAEARPDVATWLAQMAHKLEVARERAGGAARGSTNPADGRTDTTDEATDSGLIAVTDGAPQTPGVDRLPVAASDRARHVGVRAEAQASPTATAVLSAQADTRAAFGAVLGESVAAAATGARSDAGRTDSSVAQAAMAASAAAVGTDHATPAAPAAAATVAEDSLAQAVGSREFAQALGARVAVFARDGVEHARLNLHPAELGPISLKLALDGTQLRVDMSAEAAQTRQVLEQSLPGLASALRDAGLTLSGGGVFQQARDGGNGFGRPAEPGRSGRGDADAGAPIAQEPLLVSRPVRLDGLVDLYA